MSAEAPRKKPAGKAKKSPVLPASHDYQPTKPPDRIPTRYFSISDLPPEVKNRVWTDSDRENELKRLTRFPAPEFKIPAPLPSEEWDFRSCPDEEKEMCLKYELSREVGLWRQMAHNYRLKAARESEGELRISYFMLRAHFPCLDLAPHFPEWPETPWLSLDRKLRKESLEPRFWSSLTADFSFPAVTPPTYPKVEKKHGKDILYTHFEIDLTETDNTIKRDFSDWLDHFRNVTGIKAIERRGTRSAADVLKSLGATRLLRVMKWQEAANLFLDYHLDKYQDKAAWDKAEARTNETIQRFSRSFYADISSIIGRPK